ncbi:MAG TPA: glycerate kinase [Chthoniobacterales bacterium]|nr:glycerate kinase [Chthoniobacterales bacterium]
MRILVAPDKFKGCLTAAEVAKEIGAGIQEILPKAEIDVIPIADGGDGTAEVLCQALGGSWINCPAHDPLGRQIECRYAILDEHKIAVIEMSEAAGMRRLTEAELDPLKATTFGVGELIVDAARRGVREIVVGLGGSATNDGGFGLARALGYRFFDGEGIQVRIAVNKLRTLKQIDTPRNLTLPPVVGAADVRNPLYGPHGATRVFGPQKGADEAKVELLEKILKRMAKVVMRQVRPVSPEIPGAGAAGGLGFGLMAFVNATLCPGFDLVSEMIGIENHIKRADVVVTGEGRLDAQTLDGKAPAAIARLARKHHKRVLAVVGEAQDEKIIGEVFHGVYQLRSPTVDKTESVKNARQLLRKRAGEMAKTLAEEWKKEGD